MGGSDGEGDRDAATADAAHGDASDDADKGNADNTDGCGGDDDYENIGSL